MEPTMKNLLKPLLLTSMLALPLLGIAHAGPVGDLRDRRDDIRQSLRNHQDDLNTAIQIHDEDGIINARARIREDEAAMRQNSAELTRLGADPGDTETYMIKRTVVKTTASPYDSEFAPQYTVHHDPITGKPFYVRVYP